MRKYAALGLILCLGFPIYPATKKTSQSAKSKAASAKAATKKAASGKSSSGKATAGNSKKSTTRTSAKRKNRKKSSANGRTGASRTPRQSWRTRQTAPTPERYREIQQALITKGFLQGEPTGTWGPDSTEALKKFQHNQNLEASGKLDSLTLISLGLGPRREPSSSAPGADKTPPAAGAREPQ